MRIHFRGLQFCFVSGDGFHLGGHPDFSAHKFGRVNFPNGDMVGHTGIMEAAIIAVETTDECVGKLLKVVEELGGIALVTADHGNADEMYTEKNGVRTPKTSHTEPGSVYNL